MSKDDELMDVLKEIRDIEKERLVQQQKAFLIQRISLVLIFAIILLLYLPSLVRMF